MVEIYGGCSFKKFIISVFHYKTERLFRVLNFPLSFQWKIKNKVVNNREQKERRGGHWRTPFVAKERCFAERFHPARLSKVWFRSIARGLNSLPCNLANPWDQLVLQTVRSPGGLQAVWKAYGRCAVMLCVHMLLGSSAHPDATPSNVLVCMHGWVKNSLANTSSSL